MVTLACQRKKVKEAIGIFVRSPLDGGVGHVLVLVFAAIRKDSALPTNEQGDDAMLPF